MTRREEPFLGFEESIVEPFHASPGFFAFVGLACLPAVIAVTVFFGAWITFENADDGRELAVRIVGPDETDVALGWISIDSPLARAALKRRVDDEFGVALPSGPTRYVIVSVSYTAPQD